MTDYWNYIVTAVGLTGFYLAGKKIWWCWYVNIFNQVLWFIYGWTTGQWGFVLGTVFYTAVFVRNAVVWTKEHGSKAGVRTDKPIGHITATNLDENGFSFSGTLDEDQVKLVKLYFNQHLFSTMIPKVLHRGKGRKYEEEMEYLRAEEIRRKYEAGKTQVFEADGDMMIRGTLHPSVTESQILSYLSDKSIMDFELKYTEYPAYPDLVDPYSNSDRRIAIQEYFMLNFPNCKCTYEEIHTEEVGLLDVCKIHGNNSRWSAEYGDCRPCLTIDPYPKDERGEN